MVVGAAYDRVFNVEHRIIDSYEDINELQGSKYLQCKADNTTFKKIKENLKTGRLVLYSGMACQVEGLKSYLGKEYDNLYTIDLICMGIPSPIVWQKYLKTLFNGEHIQQVNFKEKSIGWDSFCFYIKTDRREFKEDGMNNSYLQSMFRSWNMRPSCFTCPFKKITRISDFTLADCWGAYKLVPEINDNKGLSSVIVHSRKGLELWEAIKTNIDSIDISIGDIAAGNRYLISNKQPTGNRKRFYTYLKTNPRKAFQVLCNDSKTNFFMTIINVVKKILT